LSGVNKKFGEQVVFQDFSLSIYEGEYVCITGESGSGKSTLLNMIGMFEKPDSGAIALFGEKQPKISEKKGRALMRDRIVYLFQNYARVDDEDIGYNLELVLSDADKKKNKQAKAEIKKEALGKVGLGEMPLDKKVYQLSGGEQQRVSLSKVFLRSFDLVLADEPTGSLDEKNRDGIMDILKQLNELGKTVIIVSHDKYVMNCAKRMEAL
jgi:putative ABC transport system ATP-binding protein